MEVNQTDRCLHFSCPERPVSAAVYVILYICAFTVILLTVCGNLLVIISVCHFKQLHTPTNMLVLSLAMSDLLIGIFVIPLVIVWMIESCWIFSSHYCISFILSSYFLTSTSIYNVVLIAVDRYFALFNPFLYMDTVSLKTMCITILCNWLVLLVYSIAFHYFTMHFPSLCPGDCFLVLEEVFSLVDRLLTFVLPCAIIMVLYTLVFVIVKKHATAIRELNVHTRSRSSKHTKTSMKSERKAAKVLGILVFVFLACLLPCCIYTLLGRAIEIKVDTFKKLLLLVYLNSTINPGIYALFYPWFRRSVKLILTLQIFKTDSALLHVL